MLPAETLLTTERDVDELKLFVDCDVGMEASPRRDLSLREKMPMASGRQHRRRLADWAGWAGVSRTGVVVCTPSVPHRAMLSLPSMLCNAMLNSLAVPGCTASFSRIGGRLAAGAEARCTAGADSL